MLRSFDREDLETLWKLVKAKHGYTRPEEGYERVLWGDLKTMFEHHVEDLVWRNLQGNKVLVWKLFDSCGLLIPLYILRALNNYGLLSKQKTINEEVKLQTLVDRKKIVSTESIVRRDLQLEDDEGIDCLSNAIIFEKLTLMGYAKLSQKLTFYKAFFSPQWKFLIHTVLQCLSAKTTAWNEFSSTMASVIICLATNQKFNFSKYIFKSMVKNLDNAGKFLMYLRNNATLLWLLLYQNELTLGVVVIAILTHSGGGGWVGMVMAWRWWRWCGVGGGDVGRGDGGGMVAVMMRMWRWFEQMEKAGELIARLDPGDPQAARHMKLMH
ncbi:hypothetical protein Tco_0831218 [Tanacetum coccineum]